MKPLTGSPAASTIDSPVNMPRCRSAVHTTSRKPLPPTPPSDTSGYRERKDSVCRELTTPLLAPSTSYKLYNKGNVPLTSEDLPNQSSTNLLGSRPVSMANQVSTRSPRSRPVYSLANQSSASGVFNRSLPFIDEDSKDEIVIHMGRPPRVGYNDPKDRPAATSRLYRALSSLFRRASARRSRSHWSSSRDVSLQPGYDDSYDLNSDSHASHNTTGVNSEFQAPNTSIYHEIDDVDI